MNPNTRPALNIQSFQGSIKCVIFRMVPVIINIAPKINKVFLVIVIMLIHSVRSIRYVPTLGEGADLN